MTCDTTIETAELCRLARTGDPDAWSHLVQRFRAHLTWTARRYRLSEEDAQDVVQATWMLCWEHLGQLADDRALPAWLTTIAARESLRVATRRRREVLVGVDEPERLGVVADSTVDVVERVDAGAQVVRLRRAIALLSPRERALVMALLQPEEPSYQAVSRRLGMPIGSVGPVRQRALRHLRALLEADDVTATGTGGRNG